MTTCNKEASSKSLKGDERKAFMSQCLKKDAPAPESKGLTPQQQKNARVQRSGDPAVSERGRS